MFDQSILEPGDKMLYYSTGIVDWGIGVKTGYKIGHIEVYAGNGKSEASRNGIGVNSYPVRLNDLVCVRRPIGVYDFELGENWFWTAARGQKYDFKGLLCFYLAVKQGSMDRMFCSEFALRRDRASNFQPFNPEVDADRTPPCAYWTTPSHATIWTAAGFAP